MALRTGITHEVDTVAPLGPPVSLKGIRWVGTDGKHNWCWASCAVIVMRYLREDWAAVTNDHLVLCGVANRIYDDCCQSTNCNKTIEAAQVTGLWDELLGGGDRMRSRAQFPDPQMLIDTLVCEIGTNRKPVEIELNTGGKSAHAVIVCSYSETKLGVIFYAHDPAVKPGDINIPTMSIRVPNLKWNNLWLNLK